MEAEDKKRLIRNIVKAIQADNPALLTAKTIIWICDHYPLAPDGLTRVRWFCENRPRGYTKTEEMAVFVKDFSCGRLFDWICCEYGLNHILSWICHWAKEKSQHTPAQIADFREWCEIIHAIRGELKVKTYNVHYTYNYFPRKGEWNPKRRRQVIKVYARSLQEALKRYTNLTTKEVSKVHRVREVASSAIYIQQEIFEALTKPV
jgi:hypothetical protein